MLENIKNNFKFWAIAGVLILVACVGVSKVVTVSHTVNGRELPIYSVETKEKKVALSFDAAWGNEDTQQILDILDNSIGNSEISLDGDFRFVRNYNIAKIKFKQTNDFNRVKLENEEIVYNNAFRFYFSKLLDFI